MQFIRFLLDDKTIEEVFTALTKIPTEMDLTWNFSETKSSKKMAKRPLYSMMKMRKAKLVRY